MEERSLSTVLSSYDKPELQDLANILGSSLSTHLRKSQMVSELQSYIRSYPQQWMSHLMERDVKLLRDLVRNGPEKVLYQDFADYPSLLEVTGLVPYNDSDANYLLIRCRDAEVLKKACLVRGILIRSCADYEGLNRRFFRVCVKTREENRELINAIRQICGEKTNG